MWLTAQRGRGSVGSTPSSIFLGKKLNVRIEESLPTPPDGFFYL
jgi:hypothetical protein